MMINRMKRAWNAILIIKREFSTETSLLVPVTSTVPDGNYNLNLKMKDDVNC